MIKKFFLHFIQLVSRILSYIPALVYGYVYAEYFTKATYRRIAERNGNNKARSVLDIGTATGHPLKSIIDSFDNAQVIGIDYDKCYIPACKKLFAKHQNVTIKMMDFYDLPKAFPEKLFDIIIFGSSFMIMPDQAKAVQIAKNQLAKDGKIYFLLTLYDEKSMFNRMMEKLKPSLKYMTTVDFGKVTYKSDFEEFLAENQLKSNIKERCTGNFFLKYFKFYIYQAVLTS